MDRTTIESRSWSAVPLPAQMPAATHKQMPSMALSASSLSGIGDTSAGIAPQDLVQRLPSIVNPTPDVVGGCDSFSQWVNDNPMIAGLGLAAAAYFLVFHKARK